MDSLEPIINYLVDPNSGLKQVITEFLNAVMQYEAYQQSGALPYERSPQRRPTETAQDHERSRAVLEK
jgi:transposase-like protein